MRVPRQAAAPRPLTREEITAICLANLLDNVTEQIYFKDLESRFLRVSSRQADVLGAESPEAVEGTTDVEYFSAEHARRAFEDEQRIISTGQPMINFEETQTWPDRPVDFMTASKYPLRDADGTIIGTFGLSSDITRRVLAEAASEAYSTEVTAANLELRRVGCELGTCWRCRPTRWSSSTATCGTSTSTRWPPR
jgi:PAS domain S-box-containing protein